MTDKGNKTFNLVDLLSNKDKELLNKIIAFEWVFNKVH